MSSFLAVLFKLRKWGLTLALSNHQNSLQSHLERKTCRYTFSSTMLELECLLSVCMSVFIALTTSTCSPAMTEDGYEAQFQVNHLSHLLITLELLPIMITTASHCGDCRIVMVSSMRHQNSLQSHLERKTCRYTFSSTMLELECLLSVCMSVFIALTTSTCSPAMTEDGYEAQFQVNHLSHLLITLELLPIMITTASHCGDCRIVMVSSMRHTQGVFDPHNLNAEQSYSRLSTATPNSQCVCQAYSAVWGMCVLHLSQVMTGYALQRRLQQVGVTVSSLHPGVVRLQC